MCITRSTTVPSHTLQTMNYTLMRLLVEECLIPHYKSLPTPPHCDLASIPLCICTCTCMCYITQEGVKDTCTCILCTCTCVTARLPLTLGMHGTVPVSVKLCHLATYTYLWPSTVHLLCTVQSYYEESTLYLLNYRS